MEELVQLTKHFLIILLNSYSPKFITQHCCKCGICVQKFVFKAVAEKLKITMDNQLLLCIPECTWFWHTCTSLPAGQTQGSGTVQLEHGAEARNWLWVSISCDVPDRCNCVGIFTQGLTGQVSYAVTSRKVPTCFPFVPVNAQVCKRHECCLLTLPVGRG